MHRPGMARGNLVHLEQAEGLRRRQRRRAEQVPCLVEHYLPCPQEERHTSKAWHLLLRLFSHLWRPWSREGTDRQQEVVWNLILRQCC